MAMAMAMAMSGEEILEHFRLRLRQLHACSLPASLHVVSLPSPPPNLSLFPGATSYQGFPATFPLRPPLVPPISTSFALLVSALQGMLSGVLQADVFRLHYDTVNASGLPPVPVTTTESMDFGVFATEFFSLLKAEKNQILYLTLRSLPESSCPSSMPEEFCQFLERFVYPIARLDIIPKGTIKEINLWMGAIVTSRLHFDALDNLHVCLSGNKVVHLYSPLDLPNLYPEPWDKDQLNNGSTIGSAFIADREQHTRFFENGKRFKTELNPGEAIFIPAGWWHEIFTLEPSISVNVWFGPSSNARFRPTLLHLKSEKYLQFMLN